MSAEWLRIGVDGVVPFRVDAAKTADDPGTLTGWASVYGVVDQQDDVVVAGAFRKTLQDWRASKRVIPLTLDHENTAEGTIGSLAAASDSAYGLKTTFRFSSTSRAQDARTKALEGHLNGLSIFGPIIQKSFETVGDRPVRILREVGLMTVGLTPLPANTDALVTVVKAVVDRPWDGSAARFTIEQWRRACLIDTGIGDVSSKERYKLPVREPNGDLNRNGVHAAAARLGQVQVAAEKKAAAARTLVRHYNEMGEEPPEGVRRMAKQAALSDEWVADMKAALAISSPQAQKAAVDSLVADMYGAVPTIEQSPEDETPPGDEAGGDGDGQNEAARFALALIGESGPGERPPGGEPSDSLAELLASQEAVNVGAELDALMAQLGRQQ